MPDTARTPNTEPLMSENNQNDYFIPQPRTLVEEEEGCTSTSSPEQSAEEKAMQVLRWQLVAEAYQRYPIPREMILTSPLPPARQPPPILQAHLRRARNPLAVQLSLSHAPQKQHHRRQKMGMVLWCASMAYGAVHVAVWN